MVVRTDTEKARVQHLDPRRSSPTFDQLLAPIVAQRLRVQDYQRIGGEDLRIVEHPAPAAPFAERLEGQLELSAAQQAARRPVVFTPMEGHSARFHLLRLGHEAGQQSADTRRTWTNATE